MRAIPINLGEKYGRLTVTGLVSPIGKGANRSYFRVECECGRQLNVRGGDLRSGNTKSCGCISAENISKLADKYIRKYEITNHPLTVIYYGMISRCYSSRRAGYKDYGGRGIKVCDEWKNNRDAFVKWCLSHGYQEGLEIDRKDNDNNYTPDNCRFVTHRENSHNTRRSINVGVTCSVEDCGRPARTRKLCSTHYSQVYMREASLRGLKRKR